MFGSKSVKYKKIVSFLLLAFCSALVVVTILGLAFNLTPNNVAVIRTTSGVVKLELTDTVTLEDNTKEKLAKKIKISSTGETGELGYSVRVTANDVMFNYLVNDNEFYFKAIGNSLNTTSEHTFRATASSFSVTSPETWNDLVKKVSQNTVYSIVYLDADLNFNNAFIKPVGYGGSYPGTPFKGVFDGKGHTIRNFTMGKGIYSGTVGLFGQTEGAIIKNLNVENATINYTNDYGEYDYVNKNNALYSYRDIQEAWKPNVIELYVGFIVGEMEGGEILNCRVDSTCSMTVKAVTFIDGSFDNNSDDSNKQLSQMIGGVVGGAYGKITNCESHANITAYNKNQREFCVSGVCGGWTNYQQSLKVGNCLFKGRVKIVDESSSSFNPTYLSYGGIVGGGFRCMLFFGSDSVSSVEMSSCVAILDNFELVGCTKSKAKTDFNNNNVDSMFSCRYSFQPIFALFPVHRTPSYANGVFNYCGYSYRKVKDYQGNDKINMYKLTDCYFTINNNQKDNFFMNYGYLISNGKVTAKFYEGARFGYQDYYYNK